MQGPDKGQVTYGLQESENSSVPVRVRRTVKNAPREITLDGRRPLMLQEGDLITLGQTQLLLQKEGAG